MVFVYGLQMKKKILLVLLTLPVLWLTFTLIGVKMTFVGDNVITPGVGANIDGVYWFDSGAFKRCNFEPGLLPDMDGRAIGTDWADKLPGHTTAYSIIAHSLIYWSPEDQSLCLARLGQTSRWYKFARWLPTNTDVYSICASKAMIYLNIYRKGVPQNAIRLDPLTGAVTQVAGALEVRAHENSDDIAVLLTGGFAEFRDAGNKPTGSQMKTGAIRYWDADAATGLVCSQYGNFMTLFEKGKRKIITVGARPYTGLSLCPDKDVIWLSDIYSVVYLVCSDWYGQVNVYNYSGTYLGQKLVCRECAYSPMYLPDPTVKAIVTNLSENTLGYDAGK